MAENLSLLVGELQELNASIIALLLEMRRLRLALSVLTGIDLSKIASTEVD